MLTMKKSNQLSMFNDFENEWEKEWKDMPEFISNDKKPVQQIIVSFEKWEDVKEFAKRIGIKVTQNTNSTWFPAKSIDKGFVYKNKSWGNEE